MGAFAGEEEAAEEGADPLDGESTADALTDSSEDDVKKQQAALEAMRLKVDAAKERSGKAKDKLRGLAGGMTTAGNALCGPPGRACKVPGMA